jgi:hypothetical protein
MGENQIASVLRTLLTNGYSIKKADRPASGTAVVSVQKRDRLGGLATSAILFTERPTQNVIKMFCKAAEKNNEQALIVTDARIDFGKIPTIKTDKFYDLLGGQIRSERLYLDNLPEILDAFGHNKLHSGFNGDPDDLLEEYVKEGLQYLLDTRAHRFGQDRLFESLPDGLVLGRQKLNLCFDAKAYEKGFHPSADDIKRFASYVIDFNERYEQLVGKIYSFLVVSGSFTGNEKALEGKAADFYSLCGTKLCHVTSRNFGRIIQDVRTNCTNRQAIKWAKIFSLSAITPESIKSELRRIEKDNIKND